MAHHYYKKTGQEPDFRSQVLPSRCCMSIFTLWDGVVGVAPGARIWATRIAQSDGSMSTREILAYWIMWQQIIARSRRINGFSLTPLIPRTQHSRTYFHVRLF